MATTALEALELIGQGKGRYEEMEHADPKTDATVRWAVLDTGEIINLGEIRFRGTAAIPGSLRTKNTDDPFIIEHVHPMRPPEYLDERTEFLLE